MRSSRQTSYRRCGLHRMDLLALAVEGDARGTNYFPERHFAATNRCGDTEFGTSDRHVRTSATILRNQSANGFGEDPIITRIGLFDCHDLVVQANLSALFV